MIIIIVLLLEWCVLNCRKEKELRLNSLNQPHSRKHEDSKFWRKQKRGRRIMDLKLLFWRQWNSSFSSHTFRCTDSAGHKYLNPSFIWVSIYCINTSPPTLAPVHRSCIHTERLCIPALYHCEDLLSFSNIRNSRNNRTENSERNNRFTAAWNNRSAVLEDYKRSMLFCSIEYFNQ